jgi:hypothetical protein
MNIKEIFEERIRGWFPKEPYSVSIGVKEDAKTKTQPIAIPPGYDLSATLVAGLTTVFYAILGSLLIISFLSLERTITFAFLVAWIMAGLTIGAISGTVETRNQLKRLSKGHPLKTSKEDLIILIIPLFLLFIVGQYLSINYIGLRSLALLSDLSAVFAFAVIVQVIRYGLFLAYEKREKVCLMQSSFRGRIIAIPKAPNGNENQVNFVNRR